MMQACRCMFLCAPASTLTAHAASSAPPKSMASPCSRSRKVDHILTHCGGTADDSPSLSDPCPACRADATLHSAELKAAVAALADPGAVVLYVDESHDAILLAEATELLRKSGGPVVFVCRIATA